MASQSIGELSAAVLSGVDLNSTGDVVSISGLPSGIIIDRLEISDWSATPSALLAATLRDAAAGGGNSLVGTLSGLNTVITSTALAAIAVPFVAVLGASRKVSTGNLLLNVSAANGSALTAKVTVYYHVG